MDTNTPAPRQSTRHWLWVAAVLGVLVLVLLQYRNPHFLVTMADQLWGCF